MLLKKCDAIRLGQANEELLQVFNVVFRSAMASEYTRIGAEYFDTKNPMTFSGRNEQYAIPPRLTCPANGVFVLADSEAQSTFTQDLLPKSRSEFSKGSCKFA